MADGDEETRQLVKSGKPWGYMDNGVFRELPKLPMVNAGLGPPPFDVEVWTGTRQIIERPD